MALLERPDIANAASDWPAAEPINATDAAVPSFDPPGVDLGSAFHFEAPVSPGGAVDFKHVIRTKEPTMAIFGIGAYYDGNRDVSGEFLELRCACVGWPADVAPPAHGILHSLRAGDLIFIKSFTPNDGLTIKAVGVVEQGGVRSFGDLGEGVAVRWVWTGEHRIGRLDDKWPVRSVTIYEEYHPTVQGRVIDLLLGTG